MLLPLLVVLFGGVSGGAPPVVVPPVTGSTGGSPNTGGYSRQSNAGHYDLGDKHKQLIDKMLQADKPITVETKPDGTVVVEAEGFTDDELQMLAILLAEL